MEIASPISDPVDSLGGLEDMLVKSVVCKGITLVNDDGFPTLHNPRSDPRIFSNRHMRGRREVRAPEGSGQRADPDIDHASQLSQLGDIWSRLPEHYVV